MGLEKKETDKSTSDSKSEVKRLVSLVEFAYYRGWDDGAITGNSDSPDWNAEEDWRETAIRKEINELEIKLIG